jgi:hypothetical protein
VRLSCIALRRLDGHQDSVSVPAVVARASLPKG